MIGGSGTSLWHATLPAEDSTKYRVARPALPGDTDADVAIAGGGYTGLWTAYALKQADPSLRVVVCERETVGFGASGRNGGWCSALFAGSPIRRVRRAGFLRNVCVALGNRGEAAAVPALVRTLTDDPESLVRGHAAWALGEVGRRIGVESAECSVADIERALGHAAAEDTTDDVGAEARAALARCSAA